MTVADDERLARVSRRRFLQDAAAAAATTGLATTPALASAATSTRRKSKRRSTGPTVAVLGGGVAGLSAAHELVERGFSVDVYERKALGGKARSIGVPGSARDGRRDLPGEHGFRFFPGFYHHIPDTMRRIPFPGNAHGVWDNLTTADGVSFARSGGRADLTLAPGPDMLTPDALAELLTAGYEEITRLPPQELAFFVRQLLVYFSSSDERRWGQWEHVSWWDYVRAAQMSPEYQRMLGIGLTRNLVAAKAEVASTRTIGKMAEAFIYNMMGRGNDGAPDRLLNAPTNEAWVDPWIDHLTKLGVRFHVGHVVERLDVRDGALAGARVRDARARRTSTVTADWFVLATPVERAVRLCSPAMLAADPKLAALSELQTDWMNGIQFYLRKRVPILHGHLSYVDAPWALTSVSQAQFWTDHDVVKEYGDGAVHDVLSVDISDWATPGILYGKPASECEPEQIAREVWAQIKAHLEDRGRRVLDDDVMHSWFLDPAIRRRRHRDGSVKTHNDEPLLVNTIGSWAKRPEATTAIRNLLLASDYVRTDIDLATMEGANEAARHAVNALLDRAGVRAEPCRMYELYRPPEFEVLKRVDAERYKAGQPNALDTPWPAR